MSATIELQSIPAPQLADLLKEAAQNGEITLTEGGQEVAKIVALARKPRGVPKFGSAKGRITVPDDFDAPLEEFKDYL